MPVARQLRILFDYNSLPHPADRKLRTWVAGTIVSLADTHFAGHVQEDPDGPAIVKNPAFRIALPRIRVPISTAHLSSSSRLQRTEARNRATLRFEAGAGSSAIATDYRHLWQRWNRLVNSTSDRCSTAASSDA